MSHDTDAGGRRAALAMTAAVAVIGTVWAYTQGLLPSLSSGVTENTYDPATDGGAVEMVGPNDKVFPKPMTETWTEEQFAERRGDPSGECPASPTGLHSAGLVSRYVKVIYDTYEHRISGGTRGIMGTDSLYCTFCWQRMSR